MALINLMLATAAVAFIAAYSTMMFDAANQIRLGLEDARSGYSAVTTPR